MWRRSAIRCPRRDNVVELDRRRGADAVQARLRASGGGPGAPVEFVVSGRVGDLLAGRTAQGVRVREPCSCSCAARSRRHGRVPDRPRLGARRSRRRAARRLPARAGRAPLAVSRRRNHERARRVSCSRRSCGRPAAARSSGRGRRFPCSGRSTSRPTRSRSRSSTGCGWQRSGSRFPRTRCCSTTTGSSPRPGSRAGRRWRSRSRRASCRHSSATPPACAEAVRGRGVELSGPRGYATLLSPLVAGSLERASSLAEAMEARGLRAAGRDPRAAAAVDARATGLALGVARPARGGGVAWL